MGKIVLVTGGARSGKSAFTEELLKDESNVCYLATGVQMYADSEWEERIRLHKKRRQDSWVTHEGYVGLADWISHHSFENYLLDSATMFTTNQLFEIVKNHFPEKISLNDVQFLTRNEKLFIEEILEKEMQEIILAVKRREGNLFVVTDEVGLGIVPETKLGRFFRDLHGKMNQLLAKESSQVYLVICGLAQRIK